MLQDRKSTLAEMRARAERQTLMSSHDESAAAWPGRVGTELHAARERLGWSLTDVAASLRIRLPYLEALEEGRSGELPGVAYAVGFVRAYASLLGLDPDDMARRYRAEAGEANRKTVLDFPAPVPERGVPAGAMALLGVVLIAIAYTGWYYVSGDRPSTQVVQQVPDRLAPLAQTAMSATATSPSPGAVPSGLAPQPLPATPAGAPPANPASASAAVMPSPAPAAPATPQATTQAAPAPAKPADPTDAGIVLHAHADSWVQVRDPAINKIIYNHVLHPGDSYQVPATQGLLLTTGNAGGLDITVDGAPAPAIGAIGGVRRDIPLDPQMIKDGKLPPPPKPKPRPKPVTDTPTDGDTASTAGATPATGTN